VRDNTIYLLWSKARLVEYSARLAQSIAFLGEQCLLHEPMGDTNIAPVLLVIILIYLLPNIEPKVFLYIAVFSFSWFNITVC